MHWKRLVLTGALLSLDGKLTFSYSKSFKRSMDTAECPVITPLTTSNSEGGSAIKDKHTKEFRDGKSSSMMSQERINALENIGFEWYLRPGRKAASSS